MVKAGRKTIQKDGRELQGVGFTVSIRPGDSVETQFGLMVDTLYQWYKKYGDACEEFMCSLFVRLGQVAVAFVSRDGQHEGIQFEN